MSSVPRGVAQRGSPVRGCAAFNPALLATLPCPSSALLSLSTPPPKHCRCPTW